MRKRDYSKLWAAVGAVLAFYSLNAWIATQGGTPIFPQALLERRMVLAAVVAIPICALLLALQAELGIRPMRGSASLARPSAGGLAHRPKSLPEKKLSDIGLL